ncbi:hypothetical protein WJX81_002811 [Elliptochloris bilobata]|uniref:J domain-containing protein n=1 Tax=Elliptochloris bilobata TaxID=381761 RepID=A0AAW1RNG5_9CHLO
MGRSRSRSRERHGRWSDSQDRRRARSRSRDRRRSRSHSRDRDRDRNRREHGRHSRASEPEQNGQNDKRRRADSPGAGTADAEAEKKRLRLEKLAAWRSRQGGASASGAGAASGNEPAAHASPQAPVERHAQPEQAQAQPPAQAQPEVWMPWEDPATAFGAASGPQPNLPPPEIAARQARAAAKQAAEMKAAAALVEDPLDAFMATEVAPEIAAKERAEEERRAEQRRKRLQDRADGKIPKLEAILAESESEEEPDAVVEIPANKIKLMVGPGGERIKLIQRKSKCRIQVKKEEDELQRAFGSSGATVMGVQKPGAPRPGATAADLAEKKVVTVMLFGNVHECEVAQRMIAEAINNKEQKAKQRHKEYEKKREAKARDRQMYHLRHTRDYEALELPIGASRAEIKAAYRNLAKLWHPDKHPENAEEAKEKFQAIQRAYDLLMSTDEDARIEALAAK